MLKRIGLLSMGVLSLAMGASQAGAQSGTVVYNTYYFSDATYSTEVGALRGSCYHGNVTYHLYGQQSSYSITEEAYICGPDGPEPI